MTLWSCNLGVYYSCVSSQVLLTHRNSKDVVKKDFLLHEVCQYRARRCLKFLVEILPEQVNIADKKSMTPLHHALRGPRNHDSAVILLKSNAVFAPEIFETDNGGTLLIELFMSDDTSHLLELTQLMLEKGPPELATRVLKSDGDTALNKLLKFFGSSTPRDREQYIAEVTATIQLLISKVWSMMGLCPWLVPSFGVAGVAGERFPPCCPVCCVVLFQPRSISEVRSAVIFCGGSITICQSPLEKHEF